MKKENVHVLIDLCQEAGRLQSLLPPLPEGITPREVRVAEQVVRLAETRERVRPSDISGMLEVTRPGITAALNNLEVRGFVEKFKDGGDGRNTFVRMTEAGREMVRRYVTEMHADMAEREFASLSDEDVLKAAELVHRAVQLTRAYTERTLAETTADDKVR